MKSERGDEPPAPRSEVDRRTALKLLAASAALSAGAGCDRKPYRRIVSMAETPEYQHPGEPLDYASTWTEGQIPYGMVVRALDGRPVKIEGLRGHPLNRGASSAAMQASILSLYEPDRLRGPRRGGAPVAWAEADRQVAEALCAARSVVLITRATLGPSEQSLIRRFLAACPVARHFVHESVHDAPRREAWRVAYGADCVLRPRLERARVILAVDADFLGADGAEGAALEAIGDFAANRVVGQGEGGAEGLNRLYVAESAMTVTGSNADHRIPMRPSAALSLIQALRAAIGGDGGALDALAAEEGMDGSVLRALARDLAAERGRAVVLAGSHLPASVHAAACLLNDALSAPGATLEWNPAPAPSVSPPEAIRAALAGGADVLLLFGVNPVYDWPGGGFEELLAAARFSVGHGLFADETVAACTLALPSCHNLESWNDAEPLPGVRSLCQPVVAPLFDARQEAESLLVWTKMLAPGDVALAGLADWHDTVRAEWLGGVLAGATDARLAWENALRRGVAGEPARAAFPPLRKGEAEELARKPLERGEMELVLLPHHALFDGRYAHNAWLQEFPDPVSKLVWDNALALGPATAARLGLAEGDLVDVKVEGRAVTLPVLVQPGVARGVAVATLGHGRRACGAAAEGGGGNTAPLLGRGGAPRFRPNVEVARAGGRYPLVRVQKAFDMHGRPIVLHGTRADYERDPRFVRARLHAPAAAQLHGEYDYSQGHKWALAVDLGACVGCGACMVACQAENNVPVVGKEECTRGREMHWLRLDRYEEGDAENPRVYQQPLACQHCDNAPCESVCPVNATAHSPEGLNEQIYNRCVGTRYCANNCPYKVRRYNFYHYVKRNLSDAVQELAYNPRVTVRSRGVMEKCTFCVQRINEVKFRCKNQGTDAVPDGAIRPACVQACPAGALRFGDVNDPASQVKAARSSPLAYGLLEELNVRPAVIYLARVRNPHPEVSAEAAPAPHGGPR